jgi:hypothetical protein
MTSKTRSFVLPIVSAMSAAFLADCGRDYPRQVCVDASSTRVDDFNCTRPGGFYHWYYYPSGGGGVAGIGGRAFGGSLVRPAGTTTFYAAPAEGVARGGFGSIGGHGGGEGGGE